MLNRFTLYKRTSGGAIQEWNIEVQENMYRTVSGQYKGKMVTTAWTECEGKNLGKSNQTLPGEQATAEANSKITAKKKEGYVEDVTKVDEKENFIVALCKEYDDYKHKITFPCYAQPKLDGIRNDVSVKRKMHTRGNSETVSCPHIYEILSGLFEYFPDMVVDGELYNHELKHDFNKLSSLISTTAKLTKEHLEETREKVKFYVFDLLKDGEASMRLKFSERWKHVKNLIEGIHPSIELVPTVKCMNFDMIDRAFEMYKRMGYEGQIVRMDAEYKQDYSSNILKRKDFIEEEFIIVDIEEGKGNKKGLAAKACFVYHNGKPFKAGIMGTSDKVAVNTEYFRWLLENKHEVIGEPATVKYQSLTSIDGNGVPRFGWMKTVRKNFI